MGTFKTLIRVANPARPTLYRDLEVLIDTGATFTKLPEDLLSALDIAKGASKQSILADGRVIMRASGHAQITIDGVSDLAPVVFGAPGKMFFLGATTLEILGFMVDPIAHKLIPRNFLEPTES